MSLDRVLGEVKDGQRQPQGPYVPLELYKNNLMNERRVIIMRLRDIEKQLISLGSIDRESIPRRNVK